MDQVQGIADDATAAANAVAYTAPLSVDEQLAAGQERYASNHAAGRKLQQGINDYSTGIVQDALSVAVHQAVGALVPPGTAQFGPDGALYIHTPFGRRLMGQHPFLDFDYGDVSKVMHKVA